MIEISRSRFVAAPPASVFAALADPANLAGIIPRVRRVELLEQHPDRARVATHMALGPFGEIRNEGEVRWQTDRAIVFSSRRPMPVEARWSLVPRGAGTDLQVQLALDLAALIGPLAALVPTAEVAKLVAPDLEAALAAVARRAEPGR